MYIVHFKHILYLNPKKSCSSQRSHCTAVLHSTFQNSTVQYSRAQYSTVQYSTVQYNTVQFSDWCTYLPKNGFQHIRRKISSWVNSLVLLDELLRRDLHLGVGVVKGSVQHDDREGQDKTGVCFLTNKKLFNLKKIVHALLSTVHYIA